MSRTIFYIVKHLIFGVGTLSTEAEQSDEELRVIIRHITLQGSLSFRLMALLVKSQPEAILDYNITHSIFT